MQSHNREKKLINNFAICDGYEYRYTEINYECCFEPVDGIMQPARWGWAAGARG